ncbi:MAG: VTT domain-containing protein [Candidatus Pacebacteria bacterium]|nr:VTT domain-containing protein [Candidatus Paceibacterota bacterium]
METIIFHYLTEWAWLGYLIAFFGMIIEGDILVFTMGFLAQQGYFNPFLVLVILVAGTFLGDTLWYKAGAKFGNCNFFLMKWMNRLSRPFDGAITENPFKAVFISKFTYNLHHAVLLRVGSLGVSFKKFLEKDFFSIIIWVLVVGGLGYISGASFSLVKQYLKFAELALLIGILLFMAIFHIIDQISEMQL